MNNKPHKHAELIKKWADGAEIQYRPTPTSGWVDLERVNWQGNGEYRLKPEVTTSLSDDVLCGIYERHIPWPSSPGGHATWFKQAVRAIADAAIKQYIKENTK